MRKSYIENNQHYNLVDESLDKKKEEKITSLISSQENPLIFKSSCSFVNISSGISFKSKLFSLYTPIKNRKILMSSSNKNKNISNSGKMFSIPKNLDNNINNENYGNGKRKLLTDFNKSISNNHQLFNYISNDISQNENKENNNINNNNQDLFTSPKQKSSEKSLEDIKQKQEDTIKNKKNIIDFNLSNVKSSKLFFTEYGLGYKCNCSKTSCDKYYCQCYNQGRYCHGCNCVNCNNKMPEYISSNKRPKEKEKEEKVSCTCTKSGCNKNYCECYKNKTKCNDLCRCRNCENHEKNEAQKSKDKIACYKANSIYIMNNKIIVEDLLNNQNRKKIKIMFSDIFSSLSSSSENEILGKKTKRSKISEDCTSESYKIKKNI
jgi:hypothetical protein